MTNRKEGTLVCTSCGIVAKSGLIDETSEWRNFGNDNGGEAHSSANRVGGRLNPYLSDFGLSTVVNGHKELQ
jgi:transcription initiation factor TFIIIB Brf1 subunit/transcription initiation factor TFIIB